MNQKELKQRLIELIWEALKTDIVYGDIKLKEPIQTVQTIADHLIANGVTIREDEESIEDEKIFAQKNIKFNDGDYARIVSNKCNHKFALGTIVQLERYESDYYATDVNGCGYWVIDDELEPAEAAD